MTYELVAPRARAPLVRAKALPGMLCVVALAGVVAIPVLAVKVPPLVDYPNHLARMFAIAALPNDPTLAQFYGLEWRLIPDLAMDLVVPFAATAIGTFAAGKAFILMTMALMLSGPFAVQAALFRRLSWFPLIAFIFIFNGIFLYGFLNYLCGLGVGLWAFAAHVWLRPRPAVYRLIAGAGAASVLFLCHLDALGIYGCTVLCYELWRFRAAATHPSLPQLLKEESITTLPLILAAAVALATPTAHPAVLLEDWNWGSKLEGLLLAIKDYETTADVLVAAILLGCASIAFARGWLRLHPAGSYVLAAFALLFLIMPSRVLGSFQADSRLPIAVVFILIGMTELAAPRAIGASFIGVVAALAIVRSVVVLAAWHGFARDFAEFEDAFARITPGSKILTTQQARPDLRATLKLPLVHMPALAIGERSSFVALTFTDPGKQVLYSRQSVRPLTVYEGIPPEIGKVLRGEPDLAATPSDAGDIDYYRNWRRQFDYLFVLFATEDPPTPDLTRIYTGTNFRLYAVTAASGDDRPDANSHQSPGAAEPANRAAADGRSKQVQE